MAGQGLLIVCFLAAWSTAKPETAPPAFGLSTFEGRQEIRLAPLPDAALALIEGPDVVKVVAWDPAGATKPGDLPQLLGDFRVESGALIFRSRFPVAAGLKLAANFDGAAFDHLVGNRVGSRATPDFRQIFEVGALEPPSTVVAAVYPSGGQIPANLLRFYLHFSAPMALRDVPKQVRLLDHAGRNIDLPFVEIEQGLWDPNHQRLTLIVHPGRIKQGVAPHEQLGPVLREGEEIRLVVDLAARDLEGRTLARPFEKSYRVVAPERAILEPENWPLALPKHGNDSLEIELPRPLDHALMSRLIHVVDAQGMPLPGQIKIGESETTWSFQPETPWRAGRYQLVVRDTLEDLAGNRPGKAFEEVEGQGREARECRITFELSL